MDTILKFGKHKGKKLSDLVKSEQSYCRWLSNQSTFLDEESKKYLEQQIRQFGDDEYVMRWGKYKNKTVNWIHQCDEEYFQWLLSNQYVIDNCSTLHKTLLALESKA